MRLFLALLICKFLRFVLRVFGGGGTALPGKAALRVCPDMLTRLSQGVDTVLVTGTNGKTTTCRLTEQMLRDAGYDCFANRSGSNLERGIAAEFAANARLSGRPRKKYAVIECDEAAFRVVCGKVRPRAAVVTNLFRDQLDRYGEVTHTLAAIREGLGGAPEAVLCLNADCPLTASLALDAPNPLRFFGVDLDLDEGGELSDAPRCIRCGGRYVYSRHTFAHLGDYRCPDCGYARPEPAVSVTAAARLGAESSDVTMSVDGTDIPAHIVLPAVYNLYNAAAAVAAATAVGIPAESAAVSLGSAERGFGRLERFDVAGTPVTVILVKNPAGCDRALSYLASLTEPILAAFCLNDRLADGTDVSWIWDASFEQLFEGGKEPPGLLVSGTRAEDMRLRLKYAGADEDAVRLVRGVDELLKAAREDGRPVYILPTYTAMLPIRRALSKLCGRKAFWA